MPSCRHAIRRIFVAVQCGSTFLPSLSLLAGFVLSAKCIQAQAPQLTTIDFSEVSGPSLFGSVSPPLTLDSVTFSGGAVLTNATNDPADPTSIYGTAYFCSGCSPTITIEFDEKASNVSFILINGDTVTVSYTIEDDLGGMQTVTIASNTNAGKQLISIPESGIRQIEISSGNSGWDFAIDDLEFSDTVVELLDPVASDFVTQYSNGSAITTDTDELSTGGTPVIGAAADGVAQVLVRIPAASAGTTYDLTIVDENGAADTVVANGGLFVLGGTPSAAADSVTVTSVQTQDGPMAFAIYVAPSDFTRSSADNNLKTRTLSLLINSSNATPIILVRPLVELVHGLWDGPETWVGFTDITADSLGRFEISRIGYNVFAEGVSATSPAYSKIPPAMVSRNALGMAYNAPYVQNLIEDDIYSFKIAMNVAAVQADIVGHSLGGLITRYMSLNTDFLQNDTYGAGPVHKLIAIGVPYLGSPLASNLISGNSECSRGVLGNNGKPTFYSVTTANGSISGAVEDLASGSVALTALANSVHPFPLAYTGGTSSPSNLMNVDTSLSKSGSLRLYCAELGHDVIANALTPTGWGTTIFGGAMNDSVVALNSQFNGNNINTTNVVAGVIHSTGIETLNFLGPAELDQASGLGSVVVRLLNESVTGPDFYGKGTH